MAARSKNTQAEDGMTAAAYDWAMQIENEHACRVRIVMSTSHIKGRLAYRVEACDVSEKKLIGVRAQVTGYYPSGDATTLSGAIFKSMVALDALLTEYRDFMATPDPEA